MQIWQHYYTEHSLIPKVMETQNILKVCPQCCLSHCVQNDTGQWVDVEKKKREKKPHRTAFTKFVFALFSVFFILCLYALFVLGFFIRHLLVPCRAFLARLQGVNESISSKHVDFCFHGDPEGLTMSLRLRPTDWWKTLLPFSLYIPLTLTSISPLLSIAVASSFQLYFCLSLFSTVYIFLINSSQSFLFLLLPYVCPYPSF